MVDKKLVGIMPRYPNELEITDGDVLLALSYAEKVRAFVKENLQNNF